MTRSVVIWGAGVTMWLCLSATAAGFDRLHGAVPVPKLNYDSLYQAAVPLKESPEGTALIAHCLARYGGEEKLGELKSFRLVYRMKAFLNQDTMDVVKLFRRDREYRVSKKNPAVDEMRILNHSESWYVGKDTVIVLDRGRYKAELFSYLTLAMPLALKTERFDGMRYGRRAGDSLDYIYLDKRDTLMIVIGIDPRDSLIKSSEGIIRQDQSSFVFINYFADHRETDGYWFAHELTNISMGLEVAHSVLVDVLINADVAAADFLPPAVVNPRKVY